MAPTARVPREKWVSHGLRVLADGGPDAVRVEPLARALGVTRGSFYWHFADRRALLDAMLDTWERSTTEDVIGLLESEGGDTAVKLRRLLALTSRRVLLTDLAIRDWARRDQAVAERLARVDNRRMEYFRSLFRGMSGERGDAEARSLLAFSLVVGNHFIAASHGDLSRAEVLERALMQLVTASAAHP
jgi:AcrR family transcriptional regulator